MIAKEKGRNEMVELLEQTPPVNLMSKYDMFRLTFIITGSNYGGRESESKTNRGNTNTGSVSITNKETGGKSLLSKYIICFIDPC